MFSPCIHTQACSFLQDITTHCADAQTRSPAVMEANTDAAADAADADGGGC